MHTPDGAPCGLLNHLTRHCRVVTQVCDVSALPSLLGALGMSPVGEAVKQVYWVVLDGRVLGHVSQQRAPGLVEQLRLLKTQPDDTRVSVAQYHGQLEFFTNSKFIEKYCKNLMFE